MMHLYIGSGPYCYANSLAMVLGPDAPPPAVIEVLTGSPFGFQLLADRLPLFDPYGWDPDQGLDDAVAALGWTCRRQGADDDRQALAMLREAVKSGPILAGPVENGLLYHQPGMTAPIGADHFVVVLEADDELIRFHDPHGHPYATLPARDFLAAWRADTIAYRTTPYTMRDDFQRIRTVSPDDALLAALPGAVAWLRGRDLPVPPGTLGGGAGIERLAGLITDRPRPEMHDHLIHFAVRVGARRLGDAAAALARLGRGEAAAVATRQARLVGGLQYDLVAGHSASVSETLHRLAPTYEELVTALG